MAHADALIPGQGRPEEVGMILRPDGRYALFSESLDFPFRARVRDGQLVWESSEPIGGSHVEKIVANAQRYRQSLHVNTGTHGASDGRTVADAIVDSEGFADSRILEEDIGHILALDNVSHHPVTTQVDPTYPPRADQVINAWCWSELSEEGAVPATQMRPFFSIAPVWRSLIDGLNFKAECRTPTCLAYKQIVWIQQGMGEFDLGQIRYEGTQCPMCHHNTENATKVGYLNCIARVQGRTVRPSREEVDSTELCSDRNVTIFRRFKEEWVSLKITTTPRSSVS
jgi:hypothetical protein